MASPIPVSPDTTLLPEKALEGFSHLRIEIREEISRVRESFRTRVIGLSSRVSAGLPMAMPVDFAWGRSIMRAVLEEVLEHGEGCGLEIGLDAQKAFPGDGDTFELSLCLFGDAARRSEIEGVLASRFRGKKGQGNPNGNQTLEFLREEGMCGWRISFPSSLPTESLPAEPYHGTGDEEFAKEYPHDVLVVDDSAVGRRLTVQILKNLGYDPAQAHNGKDALRQARERKFSVIFMDLRMPDMDGVETMREIFATRPKDTRPAVVALTAEISDVERNHCIDAGMSDFLTKPCRPVELAQSIRTLSQRPLRAVPGAAQKPMTPWREAPVADETTLRTLWEMPGGRLSTLLEDLFEALQREMSDSLDKVREASRTANEMTLRHEIHQLTGNFDVMGARLLALLCRAIGDCTKAGQHDEAKELIAAIPVHFEDFRVAVEAFIAQVRKES
ncbi:DNA-binding response regulator, OmpR family, contains REC and winged-helix (wHTH) domain [Verrucomicrobium sp. GAS474]|uniref:response regulator n=1 Tax=Verrucomicrobium sp. GAS474 TaxID=1882831 RepID=UPI00087AACE3|nr:response regulator [Verrucomicrobium sp. GAS474]SDU20615.1 DNA-binding response regulator, OmpR family, contains REC and winged-helix (wHTH) domain [Verrucomicrobium sp. GAS474]